MKIKKKWAPLSPEQEMFWLYYRFTGDSLNIIFKIELGPGVIPSKVEHSLNAVIAENDIFWYQTAKYAPRQQLGPKYRIDIEYDKFTLKNRGELDNVMTAMKQPFSLTNGPKVRAKLMQNPNLSYTLYVAAPHLVIDYFTVIFFYKSFEAHLNNGPPPGEKAAPYAGYIAGCHTEQSLNQRRENLNYWKETLKGAEQFRLPRAYIPNGIADLKTVYLRLSPERYTAITAVARSLGIPDPIFYYAIVYTALHLLTCRPNFIFPFMFAVKRNGGLAKTMGPMIGLLPISYQFYDSKSLTGTVQEIYQLVKLAHKQKKFVPHIDLIASTPGFLDKVPWKYSAITGLYSLAYSLFKKYMLPPQHISAAIRKIKVLGQPVFSKQETEPYGLMFNPRFSKELRSEIYSKWIENDTHTLGMSADNEATDYRPEGIYFTLNYDSKDHVELHCTPFINAKGEEKFMNILETIFEKISGNGDVLLKDLYASQT